MHDWFEEMIFIKYVFIVNNFWLLDSMDDINMFTYSLLSQN
jgi:hypothetical protein